MKNSISQPFSNVKILTTSSYDSLEPTTLCETGEDPNLSFNKDSKVLFKPRCRQRKKSNNVCHTLSLLEKNGNIHFSQKETRTYSALIRKVDFEDNFKDLFEKGKSNLGTYFKQELGSIPDITFWYQRYYYYSRFDEGIQMDNECWWSVTPEEISKYIAELCKGKVVIDGFCGSGGNVIQFSKYCTKVYAVDIDESRLKICQNNCRVYECADNIEFIKNDYLKMNHKIKADYVFLSPPWGGIKYKDSDVYSIKELMTPNIYDIVKTSLTLAKNIIFYLPRTLMLEELFEILSTSLNNKEQGTGDRIFLDVHVLKSAKKIKALLIIFGYDINTKITSSDLSEYLSLQYPNISYKDTKILTTIAKIIGNFKFLQSECYFKKNNLENKVLDISDIPDALISYFMKSILTEHERIKLKSYNILKTKKGPRSKTWVAIRTNLETIHEIQIQFLSPTAKFPRANCTQFN